MVQYILHYLVTTRKGKKIKVGQVVFGLCIVKSEKRKMIKSMQNIEVLPFLTVTMKQLQDNESLSEKK